MATLNNPDKPVTYYNRPLDSTAGTTLEIDFSRDLSLDHESEAPLLALTSKLKSEKAETVEFKFAIGRFAPRKTTVNGAVSAVAATNSTTITVATSTGVYFVENDVIEVPDTYVDSTHSNQLYVVSVSGDVLTVRAYDQANYGVTAIDDGALITVLFSAMKEGSSGRSSRQTVPTVYNQYCQSFEDYFDLTRVEEANRHYTGPERSRLREEARKKHALDHEYAYWLGKKVKDTTTTGHPRYQMDGVVSQIQSNALYYGATLTDVQLYDFMTQIHSPMYSGGMKRMVFASASIMGMINKMVTSQMRITPKETTWGPMISEVNFVGYTWQFIQTPVLSNARDGWAVVVHPSYLKKRVLIPTTYEMNVQNNIDKFSRDGFYSVDAVEVRMEELFGVIRPGATP
jgi:hypothetical protein